MPSLLVKRGLPLWLGLILWAGFSLWMADRGQDQAQTFAKTHALAGQRGMLVWVYDNPFLSGPPQKLVLPAPHYHKYLTATQQRPYPFSWRWLASLEITRPGQYLLEVYAAEAVRLYLNGRPLIERWKASSPRSLKVLVNLGAGSHLLDLQNVQHTHRLELNLNWTPPGSPISETIPGQALIPLAAKVTANDLYQFQRNWRSWQTLAWLLPLAWLLFFRLFTWATEPGRLHRFIKEHGWFLPVLGLAALTRLLWVEDVPGLAGESAFFMWRADLILEGALPFAGMNTRVGPLFDYLLVPFTAVFGPSVWLLRVIGSLLNLLALIFCYRVSLRELGRPFALGSGLILAVMPGLVIFARMAGDNTSLGPLLFFLGLDLISLSRTRPPLAVWAGLAWGLAAFNHGLFALLPFSLGLSALAVSRLRILKDPRLWGFGLGLALGYLPRLLSIYRGWITDDLTFADAGRLLSCKEFLAIFASTLEGSVVFQSFTGQHLWSTHGIIGGVFLLGGLALLWSLIKNRDQSRWLAIWLGLALATQMVLIPLNAPSANPRYFLYPMFLSGLLLAAAFNHYYLGARGKLKPWLTCALALFLALNLASLGVNYFYAHRTTGGLPLSWNTKLLDHTSDAWMNHSQLAKELKQRGYPVVATADFWHHTLHLALNLYQERPLTFTAVPFSSRSNTERAAVFYNSPEGMERMRNFLQLSKGKTFRRVALKPPLAQKYILLERVSPPVVYPSDADLKP